MNTDTDPINLETRSNQIYGTGGNTRLLLDVYDPPRRSERPRPSAVVIHGGGWKEGDKADPPVVHTSRLLSELGIFTVSINYRLSQEATAPAAVHDAKCAVRWLRAHADRYSLDPNRVIATGGSAGGHLALLLGLTDDPELEGCGGWAERSSRANAVISQFGITDPSALLGGTDYQSWADDWLPATLANRHHLACAVSPLAQAKRPCGPILLLHGDEDRLVPYRQALQLADQLRSIGSPCELVTFRGRGHEHWFAMPEVEPELRKSYIGFLHRYDLLP